LIELNSSAGKQLLFESEFSGQFWQLIRFFNVQRHLKTCGLATICMILNALGVARPYTPEYNDEYRLFNENNIFNTNTLKITDRSRVEINGLNIVEFAEILSCYPVNTEIIRASDTDFDMFTAKLEIAMTDPNTFTALNYRRQSLSQTGGGHFSPVGALNLRAQKVLIMDVASYKYPSVWVELHKLWESCAYVESNGFSRGMIIVRKTNFDYM